MYKSDDEACHVFERSSVEGKKFDGGKDRWDLIQHLSVEEYIRVLTYGAKKYGPNNWKLVDDHRNRYFGALLRHVWKWWKGERRDPETGLHHLAHAMCCLCFLMEPELDEEEPKAGT
jgi:hypothetical protein